MAYSNWGAFIWMKGYNVTKLYADTSYAFVNEVWMPDDGTDQEIRVGGHAVIPLKDKYLLECYKDNVFLHMGAKHKIRISEDEVDRYEFDDYCIKTWHLDETKNIRVTIISDARTENELFYIISGMNLGKGFEGTHLSKYILKHMKYDKDFKKYLWNETEGIFEYAIEKMKRKDERKSTRYWMLRHKSDIIYYIKKLYYLK